MIPGADPTLIASLWAWVLAAPAKGERKAREAGLRTLVLDGADDKEKARLERIITSTRPKELDGEEDDEEDKDPDATPVVPVPVVTEPPAPEPMRKASEVKVYSPERRGYRRSTHEEGVGAELKGMFEESGGSPFFADRGTMPDAIKVELSERLRRLRGKK